MSEFDVRFDRICPCAIRGRLIRNPNYGGPTIGPYGWTWRREVSKHGKEGFQEALKESIQESGVRNPILVWSFPQGLFLTFGGSRVRAAKECDLQEIPAIINDYTGEYKDCPEVTEDNWYTYFTDVPSSYSFDDTGFDYHYNLERARRHNHDSAGLA